MLRDTIHVVGIGGTLRKRSTSLMALRRALDAARDAGAATDLIALYDLDLPFYVPGTTADDYGDNVAEYLERVRAADALLISSAGYHGTLAGVTKNALDLLEFLGHDDPPYLLDRYVGLIAVAGGGIAAVNTITALVHFAHSMRAIVLPLQAPIPNAEKVFAPDGSINDLKWAARLDEIGRLLVELAQRAGVSARGRAR